MSFEPQPARGPFLWSDQTINLRNLAEELGTTVPESAANIKPEIGVDFIPPLTARSGIKVAARTAAKTRQLLQSSGLSSFEDIPDTFSWHQLDLIRQVKGWDISELPILPAPTQYSCGSCWAWASANMLSDRYAIASGEANPNLSPSYLLSCVSDIDKCNGGFPSDAGIFMENIGIPKETCWDYSWCSGNPECTNGGSGITSAQLNQLIPSCGSGSCKHNCSSKDSCELGGSFKLYKAQKGTTESLRDRRSIQLDILQHGPVVSVFRVFGGFLAGTMSKAIYPKADNWAKTRGVYVHITGQDVYNYGTMDCLGATQQPSDCFMGNHAVCIVGWGVERGVPNFLKNSNSSKGVIDLPYWFVRNSWGTNWNNNGFFRIAMSDPETGINMATGIDRPIRINDLYFGAVTTWLPDVPVSELRKAGKDSQGKEERFGREEGSGIKWNIIVNLNVILFVGLVLSLLVTLYIYFKRTRVKG